MHQPSAKTKLKMMKASRGALIDMKKKGIGVDEALSCVERKISYYGKLARYQKKNKKNTR